MLRTLIVLIGVSSVGFLLRAEPAEARTWSPGNPWTQYNIHGLNYRSMKWERDHGNRRPMSRHSRGRFFRRR